MPGSEGERHPDSKLNLDIASRAAFKDTQYPSPFVLYSLRKIVGTAIPESDDDDDEYGRMIR